MCGFCFCGTISYTLLECENPALHCGRGSINLAYSKSKKDWLSSISSTVWQTLSLFIVASEMHVEFLPLSSTHTSSETPVFYHCGWERPRRKCSFPVGPTWGCHNCCHGKAVPNPFSHGDNVWQDAMGLEAPEVRAQSSKSCLHLTEINAKSLETF